MGDSIALKKIVIQVPSIGFRFELQEPPINSGVDWVQLKNHEVYYATIPLQSVGPLRLLKRHGRSDPSDRGCADEDQMSIATTSFVLSNNGNVSSSELLNIFQS